ncbi:uncharacterized protein N7473_012633 [Penicillium subrubescens]|uniref:Major facilitator superfamily (MFS) profile domain-containing protein n=1 Tax=Penicillium subrubescens TaxID=1316194 RepID=A0A1Q5U4L6_9EURO|nr:uncharacterized protein N7473_012633 [Penicillium subrubescens]KAJ5875286.1 hypothetical protein N7473_012633 [Penicillium subrubescens]OKP07423.1 hypothetical protein PENSUB_6012 [Penicillium subrubescens]
MTTSLAVTDDKTSVAEVEIAKHEPAPVRSTVAHYEPVTEEEKALDKRVNLKFDLCVIVFLSLGFILLGIDKTNVGFVATSTFVKDAHLKPNDIPNSLSLFSATYVPLQPISSIIGRRVGAKWWITALMTAFGSICIAHMAVRSSSTFYALRLILGVAESGFTPTAYYYMSTFYPKFSLGFRMGMFSGMYAVAGAFAGLLAYGLLHLETSSLRGWQMLFLVEGIITVVVALVAAVIMPADISKAWFLTEVERAHALRRMERDSQTTSDSGIRDGVDSDGDLYTAKDDQKITMRDIKDVFMDWKKLLIIVFNILSVLPVTAFTTFLPLVVQGMGYSGIQATLMSVPPFVVGTAGLLAIVYSSDHFKERSLHTCFGMALGLIGCLVMATSSNPRLRYGFAHVCLSGVFAGGPLIAVWLAGNTPQKGPRAIILGLNGWSNIAGVIAGQLFKHSYAPSYRYPLIVTMILIAVGIVGFCSVRGLYMLENRRRRKEIATWDQARFAMEESSTTRRGDQRHTWIYSY